MDNKGLKIYPSWKIRGDEEHKDVLDYIFYSQNDFEVKAGVNFINILRTRFLYESAFSPKHS